MIVFINKIIVVFGRSLAYDMNVLTDASCRRSFQINKSTNGHRVTLALEASTLKAKSPYSREILLDQ